MKSIWSRPESEGKLKNLEMSDYFKLFVLDLRLFQIKLLRILFACYFESIFFGFKCLRAIRKDNGKEKIDESCPACNCNNDRG